MIQNIKKMCTDSSSDEMTPKRNAVNRTTDILDPAYKLPFRYGWKRELVSTQVRKNVNPLIFIRIKLFVLKVLRAEPTMSKEKGEVYYITPSGKKLRTRHEIQSHLHDDLTINNFTLVKEAIGAAPEDEIIRPAKYYNYARRSNVDPVINETASQPLGKRVPKPKMPKGASPPPPPSTNAQNNSGTFSSPYATNNKHVAKENIQDANKTSSGKKQNLIKTKPK